MAGALPGKTVSKYEISSPSSLWTRGLLGSGLKLLCPGERSLCACIFQGSMHSVCRLKDHGWLYSPHPCSENVLSASSTRCWVSHASCPQWGTPKKDGNWTWGRPGQTGRRVARERWHRCCLGRKARFFFFFNSEKQLPCIFVFYVSSCRSFYFFLMIKILHASQRKNIFRQSRKREERSQYNSTSLRQSP